MSLDVGDRRIGVALSDPTGVLASPLATVERAFIDDDIEEVLRLVAEYEAQRIIIGLPLSLTGQMGPQAKSVRGFVSLLRRRCSVPSEFWDERFSTLEAERRLRQAGIQPSRSRSRVDAAAATIILQGWLDAHISR